MPPLRPIFPSCMIISPNSSGWLKNGLWPASIVLMVQFFLFVFVSMASMIFALGSLVQWMYVTGMSESQHTFGMIAVSILADCGSRWESQYAALGGGRSLKRSDGAFMGRMVGVWCHHMSEVKFDGVLKMQIKSTYLFFRILWQSFLP